MKRVYITIISIITISCNAVVDMQSPEVTDIFPANGLAIATTRPCIYIRFSEKMDKAKTEEALTIIGDHQPKGYFSWVHNTLYFNLVEDLHDATIYTIMIRSTAEDEKGNNLRKDYVSSFSVGNDLIKPTVLSISPSDAVSVEDSTHQIIVDFSEPVRLDSCKKGFILSPYVIGQITLEHDDTRLVFTPYDNYVHGTTYIITLTTDIKDTAGNALVKEYRSIFYSGTDFTAPTLNHEAVTPPDASIGVFAHYNSSDVRLIPDTTNEGVDAHAIFTITFSKAMQQYDTQKSITISPPFNCTYSWQTNRSLQIIPSSPLQLMQSYTISVSTLAKDIAGNTLDTSYNFPFKVFSELSQPIDVVPYGTTVKHIYQMKCNGQMPDDTQNPIELENDDFVDTQYSYPITINDTDYNVIILRVQFDNISHTLSGIGHIDLVSAMQSVYVSYIISKPESAPLRILKIENPQEHPDCIDVYIFSQLQVFPMGVMFKLAIQHGLNGIKDSLGNYMLQPFTMYLNM